MSSRARKSRARSVSKNSSKVSAAVATSRFGTAATSTTCLSIALMNASAATFAYERDGFLWAASPESERRAERPYDALVLTPEILGRTFAEAPDPELARVAFSRVGEDATAREILAQPEVLPVASRLLGFSTAAS